MGEEGPSSSSVFQMAGEPAICINGLPEISQNGNFPCSVNDTEEKPHGPCFGKWFQGRGVSKLFGDRFYKGKVVDFDPEMKWYRVVYEDDDFEDLDQDELEEVLLPVDVSVPLEALLMGVDRVQSTVGIDPESQSPVSVIGRGRPKKGGSIRKNQRRMSRALESVNEPMS